MGVEEKKDLSHVLFVGASPAGLYSKSYMFPPTPVSTSWKGTSLDNTDSAVFRATAM